MIPSHVIAERHGWTVEHVEQLRKRFWNAPREPSDREAFEVSEDEVLRALSAGPKSSADLANELGALPKKLRHVLWRLSVDGKVKASGGRRHATWHVKDQP